jgi:hypothetical protein
LALEDAVNRCALEMDLPRKLRYGHSALVEDGFDKLSDMEIVLRSHIVLFFAMMTRKKRGRYSCLMLGLPHPPNLTSLSTPFNMAFWKLILDLVSPKELKW